MGNLPTGHIILYDDDHFYLGGVLAELLAQNDCDVTLVTPAPLVSYWTQFTLEQSKIQTRLMKLGVKLFPQTLLSEIQLDSVTLTHSLTGETTILPREAWCWSLTASPTTAYITNSNLSLPKENSNPCA